MENNSIIKVFDKVADYPTEKFDDISRQMIVSFTNFIKGGVEDSIVCSIRESFLELSRISKELGIFKNDNLKQSYMVGFIMALHYLRKDIEKKDDFDKTSFSLVNEYKYLNNFLDFLYHNNVASYEDIRLYLKVSKSTLSNFINRIRYLELFSEKKFGRRKVFYITKKGRDTFSAVNQNNDNSLTSDYIIKLLDILIIEFQQINPNPENTIQTFAKFCEKIQIAKPKLIKSKIRQLVETVDNKIMINYHHDVTEYDRDNLLATDFDNKFSIIQYDEAW